MPRIPQSKGPAQAGAPVPRFREDPRAAGIVGRAIAGAAVETGGAVKRVEDRQNRARRAETVNRATNEGAASIDALTRQFENDRDFATQPDRFRAATKTERDRLLNPIDDREARIAAGGNFDRMARAASLAQRRDSRKREADAARAELDRIEDENARYAAGARSDIGRQIIETETEFAIDLAAQNGRITEEDAEKRRARFRSSVDRASARALITTDPENAVRALLDPERYARLDPLSRARLTDRAMRHAASTQRERVRRVEKAERDAEKILKKRADALGKEAWKRLADGILERGWLDTQRGAMEGSDYRALLAAIEAGDDASDDADAVIDITDRLESEDISAAAARYLRAGKLTPGTYQSMVGKNRAALDGLPPPAKAAMAFIRTTLNPGQLLSGAAAGIARAGQAQAVLDFHGWAASHRDATLKEAGDEAREIVRQYQLLNFEQMGMATGLPRFYSGQRGELAAADLDAAERAAIAAFDAKRISQNQYRAELDRIRNWREILTKRPPAADRRPARADGNPNAARPR